ncbi:MAG: phosphoribosylamine--glycine ligase [bacterium]|nr:MAG: phosphoribosylamine--glycine ligase [bacterium]
MKVLVVGGGGREHALVWKIAQSPHVDTIYAAPGNAGIADIAECVSVGVGDLDALCTFAGERDVDLTVVGPEAPLTAGIADLFQEKGHRIFGYRADGARLEGSKVWAKQFMARHAIPTGAFTIHSDPVEALKEMEGGTIPCVVKADGLAAGKGVLIATTPQEGRAAIERVMVDRAFGDAGERIVLEEFLSGEEISVLAVSDGESYRLFVPSQDHKRAYDNDEGPNTGGMGAYAPVPSVSDTLSERIRREIIDPTFYGMRAEGIEGVGVLYFGLIITADGPKVLEYNCRFGDPETQVILPLFEGDLVEVMLASTERKLDTVYFSNSDEAAACVVIASGGYPGSYKKGYQIEGLGEASKTGCIVFHAGTALMDGTVVTSGGRVVGVTAVADNLEEALSKVYRGVETVRFTDCFSRSDIGKKGLERV